MAQNVPKHPNFRLQVDDDDQWAHSDLFGTTIKEKPIKKKKLKKTKTYHFISAVRTVSPREVGGAATMFDIFTDAPKSRTRVLKLKKKQLTAICNNTRKNMKHSLDFVDAAK